MDFKKMPKVLLADELVDIAFKRASKESRKLPKKIPRHLRVKKKEAAKVKVVSGYIRKHFGKVISRTPSLDQLTPFYHDLVDILVGIDAFKRSLASLNWATDVILRLEKKTLYKIRTSRKNEDIFEARRAFYGRLTSILKQIESDLRFLNSAREQLQKLPSVESTFTIVVAGAPNVGKSTFVRGITSAEPKVDSYPFTTQRLLLGYFERRHRRFQVVDTPGLLDRPLGERNEVEKQAILALEHLADLILFLFDPSEVCGFPIEYQINLYREVSDIFDIRVVPIINKSDLLKEKTIDDFSKKIEGEVFICSSTKNQGLEAIIGMIVDIGDVKIR
ncbi:MAG: NOG1 family protein [Candidatus Hydrothermarchaeales archaeon]